MSDIQNCREAINRAHWLSTAREVVRDVSNETGVDQNLILGESRQGDIAYARQLVYYRLWRSGASLSRIGRLMQRDHTTILAGVKRVQTMERLHG